MSEVSAASALGVGDGQTGGASDVQTGDESNGQAAGDVSTSAGQADTGTPRGVEGQSSSKGDFGVKPDASTESADSRSFYDEWDDDLKGYMERKGFKDSKSLADSYRNLERLVGEKDKLVKLPGEDDQDGWTELYSKLGRPQSHEDYDVKFSEDASPEYQDFIKKTFHEAGLTTKQAEAVTSRYQEFVETATQAQNEAREAHIEQEVKDLKKEWGSAYEQNMSLARKAAQRFGVSPEITEALEAGVGYKAVMNFFEKIGRGMGEASFHSGDRAVNSQPGMALTPQAAQSRLADLTKDKAFAGRLMEGDAKATEEWNRLHKWAYPGEQNLG